MSKRSLPNTKRKKPLSDKKILDPPLTRSQLNVLETMRKYSNYSDSMSHPAIKSALIEDIKRNPQRIVTRSMVRHVPMKGSAFDIGKKVKKRVVSNNSYLNFDNMTKTSKSGRKNCLVGGNSIDSKRVAKQVKSKIRTTECPRDSQQMPKQRTVRIDKSRKPAPRLKSVTLKPNRLSTPSVTPRPNRLSTPRSNRLSTPSVTPRPNRLSTPSVTPRPNRLSTTKQVKDCEIPRTRRRCAGVISADEVNIFLKRQNGSINDFSAMGSEETKQENSHLETYCIDKKDVENNAVVFHMIESEQDRKEDDNSATEMSVDENGSEDSDKSAAEKCEAENDSEDNDQSTIVNRDAENDLEDDDREEKVENNWIGNTVSSISSYFQRKVTKIMK